LVPALLQLVPASWADLLAPWPPAHFRLPCGRARLRRGRHLRLLRLRAAEADGLAHLPRCARYHVAVALGLIADHLDATHIPLDTALDAAHPQPLGVNLPEWPEQGVQEVIYEHRSPILAYCLPAETQSSFSIVWAGKTSSGTC